MHDWRIYFLRHIDTYICEQVVDKHSTQANHSEQNYFGGTRLTLFVYRIRTRKLDAGVHFTRITNMPTYAIFG